MQQLSERDVRIQKIEKMKTMGVIPFAQHFNKEQSIEKIVSEYSNKEMSDIETIIHQPENQVKTLDFDVSENRTGIVNVTSLF